VSAKYFWTSEAVDKSIPPPASYRPSLRPTPSLFYTPHTHIPPCFLTLSSIPSSSPLSLLDPLLHHGQETHRRATARSCRGQWVPNRCTSRGRRPAGLKQTQAGEEERPRYSTALLCLRPACRSPSSGATRPDRGAGVRLNADSCQLGSRESRPSNESCAALREAQGNFTCNKRAIVWPELPKPTLNTPSQTILESLLNLLCGRPHQSECQPSRQPLSRPPFRTQNL
jgi:hypothetical protein